MQKNYAHYTGAIAVLLGIVITLIFGVKASLFAMMGGMGLAGLVYLGQLPIAWHKPEKFWSRCVAWHGMGLAMGATAPQAYTTGTIGQMIMVTVLVAMSVLICWFFAHRALALKANDAPETDS